MIKRFVPIFGMLVVAASSSGQTFPPVPKSGWVYDGAGLLSSSDKLKIDTLSRDFDGDTGAPIVVATLPSLQSVGAQSEGIEKYSTQLFDAWKIGHGQNGKNGGILLVVAKADHKVRIELGKDWKRDYDAGAHSIDQATILPAFKRGDFAGGIVAGCQALAILANSGASAGASNAPASVPAVPIAGSGSPMLDSPSSSDGFPPVGMLFCFGAPLALFALVVASVKNRRRMGIGQPFGSTIGSGANGPYTITPNFTNDDDAFAAGLIAGSVMSGPAYDPGPSFDSSPSADSGPSIDTSSGFDSSGSFDSGSSGGGGDTGSW